MESKSKDAKTNIDSAEASADFDIRFLKDGSRSVFLYLPKPYHAAIGLIVAHWGCLEAMFDVYLDALKSAAAERSLELSKKAKGSSFSRRRRAMQELSEGLFGVKKPEVVERVRELMQKIGSLAPKRNLIAHGHYSYTVPAHSSIAADCYAFNSRGEKLYFDEVILKSLYHDISHTTAELMDAFSVVISSEGQPPFAIMSDSEILAVYRNAAHPWNPDPTKRPGAPLPIVSELNR